MNGSEYLVSYGRSGDFGRFRTDPLAQYRRGDRVIVRSAQGQEVGTVLCPATSGHARFLAGATHGELLRFLSEEDERQADQARRHGELLFEECRRLIRESGLPLEIIDVEASLDGQQVTIHHLCSTACDYRALVSTLSRKYDVQVVMQNMAAPQEPAHEHGGCGKPGCSKEGGAGGCSSCGSGGGCGTCGNATPKDDVASYLAGLRQQMEARAIRTPLL